MAGSVGHYKLDPTAMFTVRRAYRRLRMAGVGAHEARRLIVSLLSAGLFLTLWVSATFAVPVPPREQLVEEGAGAPVLAPSSTLSPGAIGLALMGRGPLTDGLQAEQDRLKFRRDGLAGQW